MMMMRIMMMWSTCGRHDHGVDMKMWSTWWCGRHDDVVDMMMLLKWWCGLHDDVVDMMMWLTWWCGWHDDVVGMMMCLTWWCGWHDDVVDMMMCQNPQCQIVNSGPSGPISSGSEPCVASVIVGAVSGSDSGWGPSCRFHRLEEEDADENDDKDAMLSAMLSDREKGWKAWPVAGQNWSKNLLTAVTNVTETTRFWFWSDIIVFWHYDIMTLILKFEFWH